MLTIHQQLALHQPTPSFMTALLHPYVKSAAGELQKCHECLHYLVGYL